MASLVEELSKLANPTPKFHDPEDDIHDETSAHVVSSQVKGDSDADTQVEALTSKFRRQTVPLLSETDLKYQGKTTSRKSLLADDLSDENEESLGSEQESQESSEGGDNSSSEDEEVDISAFKQKIQLKSGAIKEKKSAYHDDDSEDVSDDSMEEGMSDDSQDDDDDDLNSADDSGVEEDRANEDGVSQFSKTDISEDIEKGKAVKHQITLWESLLEGRIKLQKSLSLVNQLPHPEQWPTFVSEGGDNFTESSAECQQAVKTLLDSLVELQTLLLFNNPETKLIAQGGEGEGNSLTEEDPDDEEITSESEVEESPVKSGKAPPKSRGKLLKRKLRTDEYPEFLAKRHTDFHTYRNNTIQKWGEKTRLATGKLKTKSFSAFEQSAVRQIEQIMADKDRLVKRTQLKRSVYKILGKEELPEQEETTSPDMDSNQTVTKQDDQNYDVEIFDDNDFYHQLLRELIERKTSDITDPVALSRQWLEIQRLRTKVKKKVDTKASKGRKLRYDIHKKLVNFMAPVDYSTWTDEARDDLYRSLFGKIFTQATTEGR